jgi:hypothetical protein
MDLVFLRYMTPPPDHLADGLFETTEHSIPKHTRQRLFLAFQHALFVDVRFATRRHEGACSSRSPFAPFPAWYTNILQAQGRRCDWRHKLPGFGERCCHGASSPKCQPTTLWSVASSAATIATVVSAKCSPAL